MKKRSLFALFVLLAAAAPAAAQISVDEVEADPEAVVFRDELKTVPVEVGYFSRARYRAERAAIRKERNKLEIGCGLFGSLTSHNDPWVSVSGGDNSIALTANFSLYHNFTKNLFSVETRFAAKLGYNRMKVETTRQDEAGNDYTASDGVWFKNQDEFDLSVSPSFKMARDWSYGTTLKFRSQFVNGYKSRTEQKETDLKSKFMTPGYLDISLGITYRCPDKRFPFVVNLSPVAMSATFAESELIRKQNGFAYGIEDPDHSSKYEGGSSVQIDFDRTFGRTGFLRYRTMVFSFFGWITDIGQENKIADYAAYRAAYAQWESGDKNIKDKPRLPIHPTVRWTNTIDIKATKFLSTTINFELLYNRAQHVDVQTKTLLSVGLSYTFKNK